MAARLNFLFGIFAGRGQSLILAMQYKLHTARTCRVANPFRTSNPSGIARARKGRIMPGHEH
jgi:hypothetical protein